MEPKTCIPLAIVAIRLFHIVLNLAGLGLAIAMTILPPDSGRQKYSDYGGMQHPDLSYALARSPTSIALTRDTNHCYS
jgi:hypothetical protein